MYDNKPKILVTGATGQVGRGVLQRLSSPGDVEVVASARNPVAVAAHGIPVRLLDYDRPETILPALSGVTRLFLVTAYTVDMLRQSKAMVDAAVKAGVRHIVHLGACGADDTDVAHYGWHQFIERYIAGSGISFTHLRPEIYMQNLLGYGGVKVVEQGVIRHYVGEARQSWIDTGDIADVAASVLLNPILHAGHTYRLGYEAARFSDIARIMECVTEQKFRYESRPPEEFLKNVLSAGGDPAYMDCVYKSFKRLTENGISGSDEVFDNFMLITGKRPTMIKDFVRNNIEQFRY